MADRRHPAPAHPALIALEIAFWIAVVALGDALLTGGVPNG